MLQKRPIDLHRVSAGLTLWLWWWESWRSMLSHGHNLSKWQREEQNLGLPSLQATLPLPSCAAFDTLLKVLRLSLPICQMGMRPLTSTSEYVQRIKGGMQWSRQPEASPLGLSASAAVISPSTAMWKRLHLVLKTKLRTMAGPLPAAVFCLWE